MWSPAGAARRGEPRAQRPLAEPGQPVRVAAILAVEALNEPAPFEPRDRAVERARAEADAGNLLDVVGHRVAVLRAVGEADENQEGRFRKPPEVVELVVVPGHMLRPA
jgi:hypothetical protein